MNEETNIKEEEEEKKIRKRTKYEHLRDGQGRK